MTNYTDDESRFKGLLELREDIFEKLVEMEELIKDLAQGRNPMAIERAKSYWLGHIEGALKKQWGGGSFINMDDTLKELAEEIEGLEYDPDNPEGF